MKTIIVTILATLTAFSGYQVIWLLTPEGQHSQSSSFVNSEIINWSIYTLLLVMGTAAAVFWSWWRKRK